MGCDIHCFVEKRNEHGEWAMEHNFRSDFYEYGCMYFGSREYRCEYQSPLGMRNYDLFGFLAGVRGDTTPALHWLGVRGNHFGEPLRGVPQDASHPMRDIMHDPDYHSHSWLTLGELRTAWHAAQFAGETDHFDLTDCIQQLEERGGDDEIRIVFAFDN